MSSWQLIFLQSKVNNRLYDEEKLPPQSWKWPQGTWFQKRLGYARETLQRIKPRDLETALLSR
jgi:hypothetical protein